MAMFLKKRARGLYTRTVTSPWMMVGMVAAAVGIGAATALVLSQHGPEIRIGRKGFWKAGKWMRRAVKRR